MEPKEYEWITPETKGILGSLNEQGVVTLFIAAGEGSSVRGTTLFNAMMEYFGDEVVAIHGIWRKNIIRNDPSTNIDKVNELTASGMPLTEALRLAWTATRAAKLGYRQVRLLGEPIGKPGAYTAIDVWIDKPEVVK